jgi:hypothetical protein
MSKTFTEEEFRAAMAQTIIMDRQVAFMRWALQVAAQVKIPEEIYNAGLGMFQAMTAQPQQKQEGETEE